MEEIKNKIIELIKESREWIKITLFIFLSAIFLGIVAFFWRELPFSSIIDDSVSKISDLAQQAKDTGFLGKFLIIYQNNILSMTLVLFGGVILGLFTVIGLFVNGLLLGYFSFLVAFADFSVFNRIVLFIFLLPHGVIEIFIFIVVSAWGLKLGIEFLLPKSSGMCTYIFLVNLRSSFYIFICMVVGLALAAFVEVLDMKIVELLVR